jgi:hypothetical protein
VYSQPLVWQRNCCKYLYRAGAIHPFGAHADVARRIGPVFPRQCVSRRLRTTAGNPGKTQADRKSFTRSEPVVFPILGKASWQ